jgi:shikimate kinase
VVKRKRGKEGLFVKRSNVVLVGFMGTGKSTVGQKAAAMLGWKFVDSDELIVQKAGMPIPDIFAQRGEAAFRTIESEVIREAMQGREQVLATGGGAVLAEENRAWMQKNGLVVALTAPASVIVERVRNDRNRPLLQGNVEERVAALMEQRRNAYDFADLMIDTSEMNVEEIAAKIVAALRDESRFTQAYS